MKTVTFCIPVKDRMKDLKLTLKSNLDAMSKFPDEVELIVHCFDDNDEVENWVNKEFSSHLKSGELVFRKISGMDLWHFSKAKNSFKNVINSEFYSSLDGDNYITESEIKATLDTISKYNGKCFIHHWSGKWGDGSSGRITVPKSVYESKGYLDKILPRQFDEIGLLFACILDDNLSFITGHKKNFISESKACSEFVELSKIEFNTNVESLGEKLLPENPRGIGYINDDIKLKFFHELNSLFTFYFLSSNSDAKERYIKKIKIVQEKYAHLDIIDECFPSILSGDAHVEKSNDKTVYSVIKNDNEMLDEWYAHYKNIGVTRFILIDDGSDISLNESLPYDDVYIYKPLIGDFKCSKIFWISTLIKKFQHYDSWFLMVDADEFVDLPSNFNLLNKYCSELDKSDISYSLGMLTEMLPEKLNTVITKNNYISKMNYYFCRPENDSYGYQNIPSIKWAFGECWYMSFKLDFRFRYYNVVDSLRKFPLLKWKKDLWFNQGFHALRLDCKEISKDIIFSSGKEYLTIRHYKMFKFLSSDFDVDMYRKTFENYHPRTTNNLDLLSRSKDNLFLKSWDYSPFKRQYQFGKSEQ